MVHALCVLSQEGENPLFPKVKEQMSKPEAFTIPKACWRGDEQCPRFVAGNRAGQLCAKDSSAEGMSCTGELNRYCLKQSSIRSYLDSLMVTFETYFLIWFWSDRTESVLNTGSSELSSVSTRASWCSPLPPSWAVLHHFWHKYFPASASETSFPSQSLKHRALLLKNMCCTP